MDDRFAITQSTPEPRAKAARAYLAFGLWLRAGFIGACALTAGLLELFQSEADPVSALALAVGGAALAAIGGWRCRVILDSFDRAEAVTAAAATPAGAASGSPACAPPMQADPAG